MTDKDIDAIAVLGVMAVREIGFYILHRWKLCDGYRSAPRGLRRIDLGVKCRICREEIDSINAQKLFSEWDALGLGYIGPLLKG